MHTRHAIKDNRCTSASQKRTIQDPHFQLIQDFLEQLLVQRVGEVDVSKFRVSACVLLPDVCGWRLRLETVQGQKRRHWYGWSTAGFAICNYVDAESVEADVPVCTAEAWATRHGAVVDGGSVEEKVARLS